MTPLDYIRIDADILGLNLSGTEKLILGAVKNLNGRGLMLSNAELARLLNSKTDTISKAIGRLESKELIHFDNRQSRYRRIYFGKKSEVEGAELRKKTQSKPESTSEKNPTIIKGTKRNASLKGNIGGKKFIPPTLEQIQGYISENNLSVDGKHFLKYFSQSNWVDSRGNAVKNWKQKLLTWHTMEIKNGSNRTGKPKIQDYAKQESAKTDCVIDVG